MDNFVDMFKCSGIPSESAVRDSSFHGLSIIVRADAATLARDLNSDSSMLTMNVNRTAFLPRTWRGGGQMDPADVSRISR